MNAKIDKSTATIMSSDEFVKKIFTPTPKPILFWDTCALLNYIRFIYREDPGDINTFRAMESIYNKIVKDEIYSVAAETSITEWNDHVDKTIGEVKDSLAKTSSYHLRSIDVINAIKTLSLKHEAIDTYDLEELLCQLALNIIAKTTFIEIDQVSTYNAHQRVLRKNPPAGKNEEFKDCTIWEIMITLNKKINATKIPISRCFYTVNTDDFCSREGRYLWILETEATTNNVSCCKNIFEVDRALP